MRQWLSIVLLVLQLSLYVLARLMDDISWFTVNIFNEQNTCQGIAIAALSIAIILNFIRKWQINGIFKIMFIRSQMKFVIPWSLVTLIIILFFETFGCHHDLPPGADQTIELSYQTCCLNGVQLALTNLTYSFAINTKTHMAEIIVYELVLFGEIIFNGHLLMEFVHNLDDHAKEISILLVSIVLANIILIMDLMYRGAQQDRDLEESAQKRGKEIQLVHEEFKIIRNNTGLLEKTPQAPYIYEHNQSNY